jgi:hypothetical protein
MLSLLISDRVISAVLGSYSRKSIRNCPWPDSVSLNDFDSQFSLNTERLQMGSWKVPQAVLVGDFSALYIYTIF